MGKEHTYETSLVGIGMSIGAGLMGAAMVLGERPAITQFMVTSYGIVLGLGLLGGFLSFFVCGIFLGWLYARIEKAWK